MRPSVNDLLLAVLEGKVYERPIEIYEEPEPQIYEQDGVFCSLTLDLRQAWALAALLLPYDKAEPDNWDVYRAVWDVRRRLLEALGHEK